MPTNRLKLVERRLNFETTEAVNVPHERKGKHNALMARILHDLQQVEPGVALKIPVSALGSQKVENIRAALAREIKKTSLKIATSIDDDYFYVWRRKA